MQTSSGSRNSSDPLHYCRTCNENTLVYDRCNCIKAGCRGTRPNTLSHKHTWMSVGIKLAGTLHSSSRVAVRMRMWPCLSEERYYCLMSIQRQHWASPLHMFASSPSWHAHTYRLAAWLHWVHCYFPCTQTQITQINCTEGSSLCILAALAVARHPLTDIHMLYSFGNTSIRRLFDWHI